MKYDITPEDIAIMEHDLKSDRTLKHLRNMSFYKFSIGDVLVRENKSYSEDINGEKIWRTETGSGDIPHKYVYIFENELNVGYIRRLSVNGRKFVDKPICITELDPDETRFKLDPEYADHMLLSAGEDTEFDASSRYDELKKRREALYRRNKKLAIPIPDLPAALAWMKTLNIGDQLWWGHSINNIYKEPYYIEEVNLTGTVATVNKFSWNQVYGTPQPREFIRLKTSGSTYSSTLFAESMPHYYLFTQRPQFLDEVVN